MRKIVAILGLFTILGSSVFLSVPVGAEELSIGQQNECGSAKLSSTPEVRIVAYTTDTERNVKDIKKNRTLQINQLLPKVSGVPLYSSVRAVMGVATRDTRLLEFSIDTTKLPANETYYLLTSRNVKQTKYTYLDTSCNSIVTYWGNRYLYATPTKVPLGTDMYNYTGTKYQVGSLQ